METIEVSNPVKYSVDAQSSPCGLTIVRFDDGVYVSAVLHKIDGQFVFRVGECDVVDSDWNRFIDKIHKASHDLE